MAIITSSCLQLLSSKCVQSQPFFDLMVLVRPRYCTDLIQTSKTRNARRLHSSAFHSKHGIIHYTSTSDCKYFHARRFHTSSIHCKQDIVHHTGTTSLVRGPTSPPLLDISVGQTLVKAAEKWPHRDALVIPYQEIRKSFSEVLSDVNQLADSFVSLGLRPGDRVGMWGPNSYEWYLTQFATATAGLVLVNVNPAYQPPELLYALNKVGVSALVASEKFKTQDYHSMLSQIMPEMTISQPGQLSSSAVPSLKHVVMLSENHLKGAHRFVDVFSSGGKDGSKIDVDIHAPCNIQFTSGTTGSPKAVSLSHHNIVNNAFHVGHRLGYGDKHHRICVSVPLYHCFGNVMATLCSALHGATCVFPCPSFSPMASVKAVETEKCTSIYGTPTMFVDMLAVARDIKPDVRHVETGIMAGAPCPEELCRSIVTELNMSDFVVCYGLTEVSPVCFQGFCSDTLERKVGTIGYPANHVEVAVKNKEGDIAAAGEMGELVVRGYSTMLGYWGDSEKTEEVMEKDGWFHTGDLAVIDSSGYGKIVGRIKDMIIRGGENIYPVEVEEFLYRHPAVEEVQVVGIPCPRLGEEVAAWIKLKSGYGLTEGKLREFCEGKLAHFKVPKYVFFVEEFPVTVTGKIQKYIMREKTVVMIQQYLEQLKIRDQNY